MAMPDRNGGARTIAVRLTEVPLIVRRRRGKALYEAAVADRDLDLAMRLDAAIERPSDRIYWVPEPAVRKVLR
jgi:hypothetical protein